MNDRSTLLVVNDHQDQLEMVAALLRKAGYEVLTAGDGEEGLDAGSRRAPDLAISDVMMPRMSGIEMTRQMRANPLLETTPILLVSAVRVDSESAVEGLQAGADDYLEIPFDPPKLVARVARLIERKRAEDATARLAAIVDSSDDAIIGKRLDGIITSWNAGAERIYGHTAGEVIGKHVSILAPPGRVTEPAQFAERLRRGEHVRHLETVRVTRDGRQVNVSLTISPITDPSGRIIGASTIARDITERRRAEAELRASQEHLQLALDATGLGPWDWDLRTNRVAVSPEWKRQIGYRPDEIADRYEEWERRLHPDDLGRVLETLRDYLEGRQPDYAVEFRLRHKDGSYRWIYTRAVALRDATGKPMRLIGCHLDITERKSLEEQLRQSQKMEAVGRLAGGVAHDFNNLLTAITGYSDLSLRKLDPDDPLFRNVTEIKKATERAAALTRQLLAFSRRQVLQPKVLDLNAVVADLEKMLGRMIGEDVELVAKAATDLGRVKADPGQIEQVIINLAVNARDAMPGGGKLTVETSNVYLDERYVRLHVGASVGPHVMLAVADTGTGMDKETLSHIFEPFFTTKEAGKGTGLGLSTVYGIVRPRRPSESRRRSRSGSRGEGGRGGGVDYAPAFGENARVIDRPPAAQKI